MLNLTGIRKSYNTADFTQAALDDVSVSFRDNEFAAVLGPSGSGKTTMLNIIGGLDHYDDGDLEIDGVSTKEYRPGDWDTYRNNRIGFVFQSYNLISHQSLLSNVELALTLSGVPAAERRARATKALEEVGLRDHMKKRPNQLSNGQMQRVAIARALINDPEILLADEPTGALDTVTSKQVMDLLAKIAKDRLVIMVTHNSELAENYANRIIHLSDGKIVSDSRPFDPAGVRGRSGREAVKAGMSFLTAMALSFSNLMTKKGRTFMTSFAGSIGIIGIATIIAVATGTNAYIEKVERETLSIYPLTIQKSGFDITSILSNFGGGPPEHEHESEAEPDPGDVRVQRLVETMFSYRNSNDLASLKSYLDESERLIGPHVNSIEYMYDVTPQIYLADTSGGVNQVNPDSILSPYGMGDDGGMGAFTNFGGMMGFPSMNIFSEMPSNKDMYEYQYDVLAGRWPENYNEAILVLSHRGGVSDFQLYQMGLRDRADLKEMAEAFMNNTEASIDFDKEEGLYSYETLMSAGFKIVNPADRYQYDESYRVWVDKSSDEKYMKALVDAGLVMKIVGVVKPNPDETATSLSSGVYYTPELIRYLMTEAANSNVVRDQMSRPTVNVLSGKTFAQENEEAANSAFDFSELITIDEDAIRDAFNVDTSQFSFDISGLDGLPLDMAGMDLSGMDLGLSGMELPGPDFTNMELPDMTGVRLPDYDLQELTNAVAGQVNIDPNIISGIMVGVLFGFFADSGGIIADPDDFSEALAEYLARPKVQEDIQDQLLGVIDPTAIQDQINEAMAAYIETATQAYMEQMSIVLQSYIESAMQSYITQMMGTFQYQIQTRLQAELEARLLPLFGDLFPGIMREAMADLPAQMQKAVSFDQDMFAEAFMINMAEKEILDLMTSLMNPQESTFERNLNILGYADPDEPSQIDIYPKGFDSKQEILSILDGYNRQMEAAGEEEKVVRYTDIVGTMMSSVASIINMVSSALIAFVAISLIVSSIMIGVITYISVLERTKEIGILRAVGASRRDIRRVFNAETLIIGFIAGVIGILATYVICIPVNAYILNNYGVDRIAQLLLPTAIALIGVSMFLTFIAGLFPSAAAARRDPVEALRSE